MKTFRLTAIIVLLLTTAMVYAQECDVPKDYVLEKPEDFAFYESDILKCINWLLNTPVNDQPTKRKEVNAFVLKWISGSPNVTIEMNMKIADFAKPNPELLMIFMCGWTKYSLESRVFNDKVMGNLKGVEAVIDFYTKNKAALEKDKNAEKYIKLKEQGKLEEYIKSNI
jgi:hypothetical protein